MLAPLRSGAKAALAGALARLERTPDADDVRRLLDGAYATPRAHVVGITGPPGVGKSTLLSALIQHWRAAGERVGVIAIDPSSRRTGGALLGDRARLVTDPADDGIFVRSMAARDRLGGLAELTLGAMVIMRALYDRVVIETVGVGQSETDVAGVADTVLFCVQPGSGDSLQFMKAGIVEIPHIVAVTKADLGTLAERARADVAGALSLGESGDGVWKPRVLAVSSQQRAGIAALAEAIDAHGAHLRQDGRLAQARHVQAQLWVEEAVRERFGRDGLRRAGDLALAPGASPFARIAQVAARLSAR
ncbi:methylmalonyl Co-A mutase-associated GTPase MeaB [Vineibacter terrae]|uniref:Methylmalonyl Co-A mutase-associated GTPase MeaB n=1 Tax=Vineibacter terrae TaxID=2586908 RepID=A0A5C8PE28_9HYPH|nr:methylmalonyl Co-A mutase-associated GTPase MeaB [Vineibacter terrae]